MSAPRDILGLLQAYLDRHQLSQVSYSQLLAFVDRYLLENPNLERVLEDLRKNTHKILISHLDSLEQEGTIRIIRKESNPVSIIYPGWIINRLHAIYQRAEEKPELPYPNEDSVQIDVPIEDITVVDIKNDFMVWLSREEGDPRILRISFPDGIMSMITTSDLLRTKVLQNAVHKIRHYLRDTKNMSYTRQKLTPLLRTRELAVKDMLHSIVTTPDTASQTITEPSDFSFHLWTQLGTNIIKEFGPKSDKMAEEHGFCQAAYLIGYYNVYFRGQQQKRKEEDTAINILMSTMKRAPYSFRISDIYEFKDDKGIYLTKRLDKERINQHIEERLKPISNKDVPEFLKIHTTQGEDFFMLYTSIPTIISDNIIRAQKEMREFYSRSWMLSLKQDIEFTTMYNDEEFRAHIEARLRNHYALFYSLLSYPIIFFASRLDGINETHRNEIMDLLNVNGQKIKPLDTILRLNRKRMLDDAKMMLPAWMVIPIVRGAVRFMRRLFLGKAMANQPYATIFDHEGQNRITMAKKRTVSQVLDQKGEDESGEKSKTAASARQQATRFRSAAKSLEADFLPPGSQLLPTLESLAERWNTQLDPTSKQHLTEDVNSLARDFLRRSRITAKSKLPSSEDIRIFAHKLWEMDNLLQIRNRKDLLRYLELYIINLLENMPS